MLSKPFSSFSIYSSPFNCTFDSIFIEKCKSGYALFMIKIHIQFFNYVSCSFKILISSERYACFSTNTKFDLENSVLFPGKCLKPYLCNVLYQILAILAKIFYMNVVIQETLRNSNILVQFLICLI